MKTAAVVRILIGVVVVLVVLTVVTAGNPFGRHGTGPADCEIAKAREATPNCP
jgi:hypothetical protein